MNITFKDFDVKYDKKTGVTYASGKTADGEILNIPLCKKSIKYTQRIANMHGEGARNAKMCLALSRQFKAWQNI